MAASVFALLVVALSLAVAVHGCSVVPQGCKPDKCKGLSTSMAQGDSRMGFWLGIWNKNVPKATANKIGGPYVNYEVFLEVGKIVKTEPTIKTMSGCCSACAKTDGCWQWHFFPALTRPKRYTSSIKGYIPGIQCYLIAGGSDFTDDPVRGTPYCGTHSFQLTTFPNYDASWVGGLCNGNPGVVDDPHFTGALGTRFDFNGALDRSFCLATDRHIHINVLLGGYEDLVSSLGLLNSTKALRTWIKEVGINWQAADGSFHTAHLVARGGKEQSRGTKGFLQRLIVDGADVEVPAMAGDMVASVGGFTLALKKSFTRGNLDVDAFSLVIGDLADISLQMRVAHPLLQTPTDAQAHFNIHINHFESSDDIHGVLGQTFRKTNEQIAKAQQYSILSRLLRAPVVADGATGKGFLDGDVADYVSTDILATDCHFSAFRQS